MRTALFLLLAMIAPGQALAANQVALEIAGHWGVPTLVVDGEPFFGQDRIEMAKWRMEQKGLRPR